MINATETGRADADELLAEGAEPKTLLQIANHPAALANQVLAYAEPGTVSVEWAEEYAAAYFDRLIELV